MIIKTKHGYKVMSHKSKKCFGIYPSRKKAEARLRQIKYFGSIK